MVGPAGFRRPARLGQAAKPWQVSRFPTCPRANSRKIVDLTCGWPTQTTADVVDLPRQIDRAASAGTICHEGNAMAIMMPASDQAVLARRAEIVAALRAIVPGDVLMDSAPKMRAYESDGLTAYRQPPMVVVLPDTTEQVSLVLKYCAGQGIKVVPRGSGTSLSGGALPLEDGVLLGLGKFKRIREIDFDNRAVVTEPGVTNLAISQAVAHAGFYYTPDPSSQIACSIGGNVAENSGGVHCLKYGLTVHNVLRVRGFTIDGDLVEFGSEALDSPGYDLLALIHGSEGMLAVITEVTVRLLANPPVARCAMASFDDVENAGNAVAAIIAAGIVPAGLEMLDRPAVRAVEEFAHSGYDVNAA